MSANSKRAAHEAPTVSAPLAAEAAATRRTVLWLVAGMLMLQPLATDLYLPTLPLIATRFAATTAQVQLTLSLFIVTFGVWQLVAGPLSDRFGRLPVALGGIGIYAVASIVCAAAPSIEVLIAGRVLQAIGACSCVVTTRAYVRDLYTPDEGARLLAAASSIMALGPLFGPLLGAVLAERFGWRAAFAVLALFSAALLVASVLHLAESNVARNPRALHFGPMRAAAAQILRSPTFRAYAFAATASYSGLFAYLSGSSFVLMRVFGLSPTAYGVLFATMPVGYLAGTMAAHRMLARHPIKRTVSVGIGLLLVSGVSMAVLAIAGVHHPAAIVVPMVGFGAGHGFTQPASMTGAIAPFPQHAGLASALLGVLMMASAATVGFVIGATYNGTVYPLTFTICAMSLVALVVGVTLVRKQGHV
ncbi:MAG TPA: multidrug effflux MFS transporter [Burkholderiaceae bacterium]|nr:multidrug effflux MFS transporter [Burkholderiaceae bacterium]